MTINSMLRTTFCIFLSNSLRRKIQQENTIAIYKEQREQGYYYYLLYYYYIIIYYYTIRDTEYLDDTPIRKEMIPRPQEGGQLAR